MLPTYLGCDGYCLLPARWGCWLLPVFKWLHTGGRFTQISTAPETGFSISDCIRVLYFNSTKNVLVSNPAVTNNKKSEKNLKITKYDSTSWRKIIHFLTRSVTIILFPFLSLLIKAFLQNIFNFFIYKCKKCKKNRLQITEVPIFHSSCLSLSCQTRYCYSTKEQSKNERYLISGVHNLLWCVRITSRDIKIFYCPSCYVFGLHYNFIIIIIIIIIIVYFNWYPMVALIYIETCSTINNKILSVLLLWLMVLSVCLNDVTYCKNVK